MFAFLIISSRLLIPDHPVLAVIFPVALLITLIDLPFLSIDGWIGRYPPEDQKYDQDLGLEASDPESKLYRKHQLLKRAYIVVDVVYITVAIFALVAWIATNFFTRGISYRVYIVGGIYLLALAVTIFSLLIKGSRRAVCGCMPYFLGPFIARCIRFYYKTSGQFHKFGNSHCIHEYIGC